MSLYKCFATVVTINIYHEKITLSMFGGILNNEKYLNPVNIEMCRKKLSDFQC